MNGIAVYDENGDELGVSKKAAQKSILQVCTSRITMAAPGMCKSPIYPPPTFHHLFWGNLYIYIYI